MISSIKTITLGILLITFIVIPALVTADITTPFPYNPYPNKIYGEEFRSAESPYGGGWGISYVFGNGTVCTWQIEFFLTPAQMDQLTQWAQDDGTMPMIDAFIQLVPEQVAALPEDLRNYLYERRDIQLNPKGDPVWSHDEINHIWADPCGTIVPESNVPRNILQGDSTADLLYEGSGTDSYTADVVHSLTNLGLATSPDTLDPIITTSILNNQYTINFQGNSPTGESRQWTLIHESDGTWVDSATGKEIGYDLQYIIAAFGFANPPDESVGYLNLQPKIGAKASLVGSVGSFAGATQSKTLTSPSSNTLANTLLSQAGSSKLSKVNIASFAANRATTASTASTTSLVSQDKVSSVSETTTGGNFDMASFAASYRSGGTTITSKGFGSDVLVARGIGG
jgi:hypothetical protein